jgi:hypothetical protein
VVVSEENDLSTDKSEETGTFLQIYEYKEYPEFIFARVI